MRREKRSSGFSMIELVVVIAVGLIVVAIGIPSLMTSYRTYQMNSALRDVNNVIFRARFEAIRSNRNVSLIASPPANTNFAGAGGYQWIGLDLDGDGVLGVTTINWPNVPRGTTEPRILLPMNITLVPQNGAGLFTGSINTMGLSYGPNNTGVPDQFIIRFNSHGSTQAITNGRPGVSSQGNVVPNGVLFFQNSFGDWGAVTVSVMGAVRTWTTNSRVRAWH